MRGFCKWACLQEATASVHRRRISEWGRAGVSFVLLDVRTPAEYQQIRIKGAKLLPLDEIGSRAEKELPDKSVPILVYCHSGARAGSAVNMLTHMGYTDAVSLGGIINWPYDTVSG